MDNKTDNKPELFGYINSISPISQEVFDAFYAHGNYITIEKGEYFAQEGRYEKDFGILTEGVVRTFFRTKSGEEYIKSFGTPYSFIGGFSSLISGKKNSVNVQSLTKCSILATSYDKISKLYTTFPEIATLSRRLTESLFIAKENRELALISLTAEERYLQFRKQYSHLETIIPQYHVASYLGITPTQLSRIRRNLSF